VANDDADDRTKTPTTTRLVQDRRQVTKHSAVLDAASFAPSRVPSFGPLLNFVGLGCRLLNLQATNRQQFPLTGNGGTAARSSLSAQMIEVPLRRGDARVPEQLLDGDDVAACPERPDGVGVSQ
jgi:hypothetical protein